jgi:hypothetical protein
MYRVATNRSKCYELTLTDLAAGTARFAVIFDLIVQQYDVPDAHTTELLAGVWRLFHWRWGRSREEGFVDGIIASFFKSCIVPSLKPAAGKGSRLCTERWFKIERALAKKVLTTLAKIVSMQSRQVS